MHSSRTFYFLYHFSCCSSSPEAASHYHLGSHNGSILFNPLVGIGYYTSSVGLPRTDFPSSANLFFSGAIAEALIRMVHRECFLGRLFLTSAAAAGSQNICIKAIKYIKKCKRHNIPVMCVKEGFIIENKHILKLVTRQKLLILQTTGPQNFLTLL